MNDKEFVSLGCYFATPHALCQKSYGFDCTRSPLQGISHSINSGFSGFQTNTVYCDTDQHRVFGHQLGWKLLATEFGKSLSKEAMTRPASRFMGQGDVPAATSRVFVRLVNNTSESELGKAWQLRQQLPYTTEIYLLILLESLAKEFLEFGSVVSLIVSGLPGKEALRLPTACALKISALNQSNNPRCTRDARE
ncbi:cyb5r2 [Symbiodinium necroappetens]|uniref:Cyb5r2 protein n=1 Tax=Symbiodinium necroappetens TaxID=1628268 RepID=A0A812IQQ1_9DINO|nr:cyb5r2 [Symbiodinium necroappetens]CAE7715156.1 cyb5r2 [Symbiodinium sp. CCMP2456]